MLSFVNLNFLNFELRDAHDGNKYLRNTSLIPYLLGKTPILENIGVNLETLP